MADKTKSKKKATNVTRKVSKKVIDEPGEATAIQEPALDWDWPHFEVDKEFIAVHNKLAEGHVGNQVCWQVANKIGTMKSFVDSRNAGVRKAITTDKIEFQDIPGTITSLVRGFNGGMATLCQEAIAALQQDLSMAQSTGQSPRSGEGGMYPLLIELCVACGLTAKPKMSKPEARVALRLPRELKEVLGIDSEKLLSYTRPDIVVKMELLETYLDEYYRMLNQYQAVANSYSYDGPVPEDPLDDLKAVENMSAKASWTEQTHTVEV